MTQPGVMPRDDRAWPRSSVSVSVVIVLASVGAGAGLVVAVAPHGAGAILLVASVFVGSLAVGLVTAVRSVRTWIAGHDAPPRYGAVQWIGVIVGMLLVFVGQWAVGGAGLAGVVAGMLVANIWGKRAARKNRLLVDRWEAAAATADVSDDVRSAATTRAGPVAPVGRVLAELVAVRRTRWTAWLLAAVAADAVCVALGLPDGAIGGVVLVGPVILLGASWRLWAAWRTRRDFERGATSSRQAFVILLCDPSPRMVKPLLGVWSERPTVTGGRLPAPEQVFRCDPDYDALLSFQGSAVVHQAWLETRARPRRWPRWVAADDGVAVPLRRALLGVWYLSNLVGGERPGAPRPLTSAQPRPESTVVEELDRRPGGLLAAFAWRLVVLAGPGLLLAWLG